MLPKLRNTSVPTGLMVAWLLWLLSGAGPDLSASPVTYTVIDLPDTVAGEDLWEFQYVVTWDSFGAGQGFTIFFDRSLFASIQASPTSVNAGWDILTVQPDLLLESDGFYDALALRNGPALSSAFTVQFVWRDAGSPAGQLFSIHDADFKPISEGVTQRFNDQPALSAQLQLNRITLSWPASAAGYAVQSTSDLANPVWVPVDAAVVSEGGTNTVSVGPPDRMKFYRLAR